MEKKLKHVRNIFLIAGVVFLSACNKTPIEKLASNELYPDLSSIWGNEFKNKTTLWSEAVTYCKKNMHKPNCGSVITLYMIGNGSTEAPPILTSMPAIRMPDFNPSPSIDN
jgi:hypothetical protein